MAWGHAINSIVVTVLAGATAAVTAYPLESLAFELYGYTGLTIIVWATIEEVLKFWFIFITTGWYPHKNVLWYGILLVLGFALTENILFWSSGLPTSISHRLTGATISHLIFTVLPLYLYYRFNYKWWHAFYVLGGIAAAACFHVLFNLLILSQSTYSIIAIAGMWLSLIAIILYFLSHRRNEKGVNFPEKAPV